MNGINHREFRIYCNIMKKCKYIHEVYYNFLNEVGKSTVFIDYNIEEFLNSIVNIRQLSEDLSKVFYKISKLAKSLEESLNKHKER